MPFTPFHFGPHACVSLPFCKRLDVFTFICANVAVDLEPLAVMLLKLDYPMHGYCHTFLGASVVGCVLALCLYPFRKVIQEILTLLQIPSRPTLKTLMISGVLGGCMHVLFDAVIYPDVHPFYPSLQNPLCGAFSISAFGMRRLCLYSFIPALLIYIYIAARNQPVADDQPGPK